ncbi:uncharacterized protein [Anabrus simplex]|uniref:uncharacterized protein n=1 Tax=Anabrus simplex TaxID=316456 RepID=UPI0034DD4BB0
MGKHESGKHQKEGGAKTQGAVPPASGPAQVQTLVPAGTPPVSIPGTKVPSNTFSVVKPTLGMEVVPPSLPPPVVVGSVTSLESPSSGEEHSNASMFTADGSVSESCFSESDSMRQQVLTVATNLTVNVAASDRTASRSPSASPASSCAGTKTPNNGSIPPCNVPTTPTPPPSSGEATELEQRAVSPSS